MVLAKFLTVTAAAMVASASLTGMAAAAQSPAAARPASSWTIQITGEGATLAIAEANAVNVIDTYQLCIAKSVPRAYGEYSNGTWWATMMGICNNN